MGRWRGRRVAGLAAVLLVATVMAGAAATREGAEQRWVVVRDDSGAELARAALPASGAFALRYRNSVYESTAEEHFRVDGDELRLVELAANELAVLEEYYTAVGAQHVGPGPGLAWRIAVERPPIELPLRVQATALGERTLLTEDEVIALYRLVESRDDTVVVLTIEGSG